ncbi:MAG: sigma-70 family RNA polymerase sigma factor [Bacteroidetes bacterium]|nr:sigma-70 family RNA polymerase sigma factor [Bacteroidota bacterium]
MNVLRLYTDDNSIIQGIRDSDDRALKHLYKTYYTMIRSMIINNNGSNEDADDVFQEGIIALYEKVRKEDFVLTCKLSTYLYSVCRFNWLRKIRDSGKQTVFNDFHNETIAVEEDLFEKETLSQRQRLIATLLNEIGESCRKIITGFYYDALSTKQISDKYNLSGADYVKTQKYRCLQKLRELMKTRFSHTDIMD